MTNFYLPICMTDRRDRTAPRGLRVQISWGLNFYLLLNVKEGFIHTQQEYQRICLPLTGSNYVLRF